MNYKFRNVRSHKFARKWAEIFKTFSLKDISRFSDCFMPLFASTDDCYLQGNNFLTLHTI